jgi:WD40 repeat protein
MPQQVVFSTDGATMVTSGADTKILVWNAKTGERIAEFTSRERLTRVPFSGDLTRFLFICMADKITRVDLTDGRLIESLKLDGTWPQAIARSNKNVVAVVHSTNAKSTLVGWRLK